MHRQYLLGQAGQQCLQPSGCQQEFVGIEGIDPVGRPGLAHLHHRVHEGLLLERLAVEMQQLDPLSEGGGLQQGQTCRRGVAARMVEHDHRIHVVQQGMNQGHRRQRPLVTHRQQADHARRLRRGVGHGLSRLTEGRCSGPGWSPDVPSGAWHR